MLPLTVGIRDGAVQMVSTLGSVVISARAELGSIITSALPVATMLTHHRVGVEGWVPVGAGAAERSDFGHARGDESIRP